MFYWQFNRAWCIKEVQSLVRVVGLGYSDGARNLEVMLESLSGGRRREIQEDGIVMEVKNFCQVQCGNTVKDRSATTLQLPPPTQFLFPRQKLFPFFSSAIPNGKLFGITTQITNYSKYLQIISFPTVTKIIHQVILKTILVGHTFLTHLREKYHHSKFIHFK